MRALILIATIGLSSTFAAQIGFNTNLLASDIPGLAAVTDPTLINPWGLSASSGSPLWLAVNGNGTSELYNGAGVKQGLVVSTGGAAPTGTVFNGAAAAFNGDVFLFASEDGEISGWRSGLGTTAEALVNASTANVYKGLAIGTVGTDTYAYAANFRTGNIDVLKGSGAAPNLTGNFIDPSLPAGYAPFDVQNLGGVIYVTYALQDPAKHDDVPGAGHGFVAMFDQSGNFLGQIISGGLLDSPWGIAIAPAGFGDVAGDLLVGNFGDGRINAYNATTGVFVETLEDAGGNPINIDGLWALRFGNGGNGGSTTNLFFTAGINGEADGLFGDLATVPEPGTWGLLGIGVAGLVLGKTSRIALGILARMNRALLLLFLTLPAIAADKAAALDALVARYHELGLFNGSALVAENGHAILRKGYGEANMEWHIPNAPDTRFRLGSITKQFTATLVMQMVEKGQINLNAPIAKYLPDYPKPNGDRITIHQLLNHTSGIPGYTELPAFGSEPRHSQKPEQFMKMFSGLELLFEAGSKFSYSNSGYFLLGVILEKVSGKSYEQLLRERIFDPLGMKQSGYDSTRPLLEKRAAGYDASLDGYSNTSYLDMGEPYAAGSLYSSVDDLLIWDQALYGEKVLSAASKEKMFTPSLNNYGYALVIHKGAITTIEHGGGINGFNTVISRDIEAKRLYVLLNNTGGAPMPEMVDGLRAILDGKEAKLPKTPAAPVLYKTWQTGGIRAVMEQWKSMKEGDGIKEGSGYDTREGELTRLGGTLLGKGKVADALELARAASAQAPKSANVAQFLGGVEAAAGHKVEALQAYGRAIELSDTPRAFPMLIHAILQIK